MTGAYAIAPTHEPLHLPLRMVYSSQSSHSAPVLGGARAMSPSSGAQKSWPEHLTVYGLLECRHAECHVAVHSQSVHSPTRGVDDATTGGKQMSGFRFDINLPSLPTLLSELPAAPHSLDALDRPQFQPYLR